MKCDAWKYKGMSTFDWLLLCYIFKWANFWIAPTWFFIVLWVGLVLKMVIVFLAGYLDKK